ncbi:putative RNA recognition motif domain, nucleotide-binding alpha-beta plait domain superfamily [Helianthus debilis subsp. tardiflorus]
MCWQILDGGGGWRGSEKIGSPKAWMRSSQRQRRPTEEWQEVTYQRQKGSGNHQHEEAIMKFFVSNLPVGCSSKILNDSFKVYGEIAVSYIARKLDKFGNRFGFVPFKRTGRAEELIQAMRSVKIGDNKLFIMPAKFIDGRIVNVDRKVNQGQQKQIKEDMHNKTVTGEVGKEMGPKQDQNQKSMEGKNIEGDEEVISIGTSFVDKLLNRSGVSETNMLRLDDNIRAFNAWNDIALFGSIKEFESLVKLRSLLKEEGVLNVRIKYLGAMQVMLVFENVEVSRLFFDTKTVLQRWFSTLDVWKGQMMAYERIAWLKFYGVPLVLAINPVFNVLAKRFGKLVQPAQISESDDDLSYVCVGVLCGDGRKIKEEVTIKWQGKLIRVWIEEEVREWIPDCIDDKGDLEVGNSVEKHDGSGSRDFNRDDNMNGCHDNLEDNMNSSDDNLEAGVDVVSDSGNVSCNPINSGGQETIKGTFGKDGNFGNDGIRDMGNQYQNVDCEGEKREGINGGEDLPNCFKVNLVKEVKNSKNKKVKIRRRAPVSVSPQEKNRPSKRSRKGDPFRLNKMLGLVDESGS